MVGSFCSRTTVGKSGSHVRPGSAARFGTSSPRRWGWAKATTRSRQDPLPSRLDTGRAAEYGERRRRRIRLGSCKPASEEAVMVRISVLYATSEGKKFDHDYYVNRHMKLVRERLNSFGLVRTEVDKGLAAGHPARRHRTWRSGTSTSTRSATSRRGWASTARSSWATSPTSPTSNRRFRSARSSGKPYDLRRHRHRRRQRGDVRRALGAGAGRARARAREGAGSLARRERVLHRGRVPVRLQ